MPDKENQILAKLYGLVEEIRENMVTKTEFEEFRLDERLKKVEEKVH